MKIKILLFILIIFTFAGNSYSQIEVNITNGGDLKAEQIIEMFKPALISIWYSGKNPYDYFSKSPKDTMLISGSGFIISEDGLVGTNYHVIEQIDSIIIKTSDSSFYNAEVIMTDEKQDYALLKIIDSTGKKFPFVKLGNSDDVKQGQDIYAIGSPFGYEYTISQGIVAGIRLNEKVSFYDPITYMPFEKVFDKVIQITAAISPGNSGGALFNSKGEVVGITAYGYMGYGNLNFAVAINSFKDLVKMIADTDGDAKEKMEKKKKETIFNTKYKLATNIKSELYYDWHYSKQKDTMKVYDTLIVKMDSANKVNFAKAESYYQKCMDIFPDTFFVYRDLLDLYVFTESFKKAEDLYKEIRERFTSDSLLNSLSSTLASAYSTSKDYNKALIFYEKVLKVDTNDVFIYYQIGNLYEKMEIYSKAVDVYNKLIKRDSTYILPYIQLGQIYYKKDKDYKKAKKILENAYVRAMTGYGNYTDLYYYLGMIAVSEERKLDAVMYYNDLKNTYGYTVEDQNKKKELYFAILKMNE
jgi:tetratricopeptide (TPR) repeat protein